ncbi:MAG: hypothetical protein WC724_02405 [Candidatus Paceibacterota bacterium]
MKDIVYRRESNGTIAQYFWGVMAVLAVFYMIFSMAAFVSAANGEYVPLSWFWLAPFKLASILHLYW